MKFILTYIKEHRFEMEAGTLAEAELRAIALARLDRFRMLSIVPADAPRPLQQEDLGPASTRQPKPKSPPKDPFKW